MNKEQFLLAQLAQEAAEIAKAATKCMMFGPYNTNPDTGVENVERLREELDDLSGTVKSSDGHPSFSQESSSRIK